MAEVIKIKSRHMKSILFEHGQDWNTLKQTLIVAISNGANLRDADLYGADLKDADLRYADLYGADLRDANLSGADLKDANLSGADLRDADLYDANLIGVDLSYANLRNTNLRDANLNNANLIGADLKDANLSGADLGDADLRYADLYGADLGDWGKLKDISIIGPIGSRQSYTKCFKTNIGIFVQCGCFSGSLNEFVSKVKETHKCDKHERDYLAMVEFIKTKFL